MANLDDWKTVLGEAFKIVEQDDKVNFTVRSYQSGAYINCTLWKNSHGHVKLSNGDAVVVNGKFHKTPKKDGDGDWLNLSVKRIGVIPMDSGVDDRVQNTTERPVDDEVDVL